MSDKKKIYVVQGSKGEYSDHHEWLVRAFVSEEKAKGFVVKCTEEGNRIKSKYEDDEAELYGCFGYWYEGGKEKDPHPLDPNFHWDASGFNYTLLEVELEDSE